MQLVLPKVHSLNRLGAEEAEEGASSSSSGISLKWLQWLEEEHNKGNEKVSNPNSETRDRFPQVSFNTALKDTSFKSKAIQEYKRWLEKDDKPPKGKSPEKEPSKEKKSDSPLKLNKERIESIIEKHGKHFDEIMGSMKKAVKKFKAMRSKPRSALDQSHVRFKKAFARLSPEEQAIMAAGDQLGKYFQKHMAEKNAKVQEIGKSIEDRWRLAPNMSKSESAQNIFGLVESWGVKGSRLPEENDEKAKKHRKEGENNKELNSYAQEAYEFSQAFFKHLGIKEITLFRGVKGQGLEDAKKGTEVDLDTRPLSSYTLNASTAEGFGKAIEFKIPIEEVFTSSLTSPEFQNEFEVVILGGPKKGKVL